MWCWYKDATRLYPNRIFNWSEIKASLQTNRTSFLHANNHLLPGAKHMKWEHHRPYTSILPHNKKCFYLRDTKWTRKRKPQKGGVNISQNHLSLFAAPAHSSFAQRALTTRKEPGEEVGEVCGRVGSFALTTARQRQGSQPRPGFSRSAHACRLTTTADRHR